MFRTEAKAEASNKITDKRYYRHHTPPTNCAKHSIDITGGRDINEECACLIEECTEKYKGLHEFTAAD
jgi:hypothetical protein